jgi:hypothetical protein
MNLIIAFSYTALPHFALQRLPRQHADIISPFPREQIGHLPHIVGNSGAKRPHGNDVRDEHDKDQSNITRTAIKVGESSGTNRAGTDVTIFSIVSLNQSSIGFLRPCNFPQPCNLSYLLASKAPICHSEFGLHSAHLVL